MTTIVMNTSNAAVTEYDWSFQSITATHAGDSTGLYELGGDDDFGQPIESEIRTGKTLLDAERKKHLGVIFFSMSATGSALAKVYGKTDNWQYQFETQAEGVSRVRPGRGIRENYLAFGFENINGADFRIDRIDAEVNVSPARRTA